MTVMSDDGAGGGPLAAGAASAPRNLGANAAGEECRDAVRSERVKRAERYFREDLRDQRGWYSKKASDNRSQAQRFGLIVIACGALIPFLQIFTGKPWLPYATGAIGVLIALIEGAQRIWKFDETWRGYRTASERMKREMRLYVNGAGDYAPLTDEDASYRTFVTAIEQIIAEEQQIYWQRRAKGQEPESASQPR
jgi:hypothetical protein